MTHVDTATVDTEPTKAPRKAVAKVTKGNAKAKAPVDAWLGSYPMLKKWPAKCGAAPTRDLIITARALGVGRPGTKRELAVAAYLRLDSGRYTTEQVAAALVAVVGGTHNPLLNVVNRTVCGTYGYAKVTKTKIDGGTSYVLVLTSKGTAKVAKYRAANGLDTQVKAPDVKLEAPLAPGADTADADTADVEYGVDHERGLAGVDAPVDA